MPSLAEPERDARFDSVHGTDTGGVIMPAEMDVESRNLRWGTRYEATPSADFAAAMRALPADLQDFVFVDLRCGKGRVLLMACSFQFKAIWGVEYSPALCSIAEANLRKFERSGNECPPVSICCADASEFDFPDAPMVVYMLCYRKPVLGRLLEGTDFLMKIKATDSFSVYTKARSVGTP